MIELVRGRLTDPLAAELLEFWGKHTPLEGEAAQKRLSQVLCVQRNDAGEITGVNSARAEKLDVIGGLRFWVYRELLLDQGDRPAMLGAAFDLLAAEFSGQGEEPRGIALFESDPEVLRATPLAVWPETQMFYAARDAAGAQLRIRYFDDAIVVGGSEAGITAQDAAALGESYRVEPMEGSGTTTEDVLEFWQREGAVPESEAHRRVHEVHLVGRDADGALAGVSTTYLQRNPQLGLDLWYYRAFVSPKHRKANLGFLFVIQGKQLLAERFADGTDRRGAGVLYEIENEGVKRRFNKGRWPLTGFTFIGENAKGDHVRLVYFDGAEAPAP